MRGMNLNLYILRTLEANFSLGAAQTMTRPSGGAAIPDMQIKKNCNRRPALEWSTKTTSLAKKWDFNCSRVSLSEISVSRHIRFAELRKKIYCTATFHK